MTCSAFLFLAQLSSSILAACLKVRRTINHHKTATTIVGKNKYLKEFNANIVAASGQFLTLTFLTVLGGEKRLIFKSLFKKKKVN